MIYQVLTTSIKERLFLESESIQDLATQINEGTKQFVAVRSETGQDVFLNKNVIIGVVPVTFVQEETKPELETANPHTGSNFETVLEDGNLDDNGQKLDGN